MAKSKAKKMREKLEREGLRNPETSRGVFALTDMRTRKTKTKKEKMFQSKHKKRFTDHQDGYGSSNRSFLCKKTA